MNNLAFITGREGIPSSMLKAASRRAENAVEVVKASTIFKAPAQTVLNGVEKTTFTRPDALASDFAKSGEVGKRLNIAV